MRRPTGWTLLAVLMLLAVASASAQSPQDSAQSSQQRKGFWIGFGLGAGHLGCGDCDDEPGGGFSGHLKLGGAPSRKILVGFESMFWAKHDDDLDANLSYGNASAIVQFFPGANSGFFLKGGLGIAFSELVVSLGQGVTLTETQSGIGSTFGVGWDLRVGGNLSITPVLNLGFGSLDDANVSLLHLAVGLTWH